MSNKPGYRPKRKLFELDFSETEYAGLEVTTKSISVKGLMKIAALADQFEDTDDQGADEVMAVVEELFERFARVLVSWNVEDDDGKPVEANQEGLESQDLDFAMAVIFAWIKTVSAAPPPLQGASPSGEISLEGSLDLAGASRSLPS